MPEEERPSQAEIDEAAAREFSHRPMLPIPISAAQRVALSYGYDQVIIIARRVGEHPDVFGEACATFGVDPVHSNIAARCANRLKREVMGWEGVATLSDGQIDRAVRAVAELPHSMRTQALHDVMLVSADDLTAILKSI